MRGAGGEGGRGEVVEVLHGGGVPSMDGVVFETGQNHVVQRLKEHLIQCMNEREITLENKAVHPKK